MPATRHLAAQLSHKQPQPRIQKGPVQPCLLRHLAARIVRRPLGALGHVRQLQILDHDHAVVLGIVVGEDVQKVLTLAAHMQQMLGQLGLGFVLVLASFLLASDLALELGRLGRGLGTEGRVVRAVAVAVGHHVDDAQIQADARRVVEVDVGGGCIRQRVGQVGVPAVGLFDQRAAGLLALDRAVKNDGQVAELGEDEEVLARALREAPSLLVGRGQRGLVHALLLEVRLARLAREAIAPSLVQRGQQSALNLARNLLEPAHLGAKEGEVGALVGVGVVALVALAMSQAQQALLVSEVVEEAKRALPPMERGELVSRWVEAEDEDALHGRGRYRWRKRSATPLGLKAEARRVVFLAHVDPPVAKRLSRKPTPSPAGPQRQAGQSWLRR